VTTQDHRHEYACHVRFSDVDVYGHVNNVKYFEYYQEARIAFVLSLAGRDYDADDSMGVVLARIDVDYRRPILFRAEPYAVETWVTRIGTTSYDLSSRIIDAPGDQGPSYSDAEVAFDLATGRSRPLSDVERSRLQGMLSEG
jgi:acyl-CoA thioester hydrolase